MHLIEKFFNHFTISIFLFGILMLPRGSCKSMQNDGMTHKMTQLGERLSLDYYSEMFEKKARTLLQNKASNKFVDLSSILHHFKIDPDVGRNLTELITSRGYPSEKYTVQTEDGFLLHLHRIPHGRQGATKSKSAEKRVVFVQHGLLASACDWVMNLHNDSLAFVLADAGYDVWLGNSRGNTYSRKHIKYSPHEDAFWDWSFDEMAKYDTPAFIDFILNKTNQSSVYYVGHSQGTTMAFALFSSRPEYQKKIRLFAALAPVTTPNHGTSPIFYLSDIPESVLYGLFGRKDFLPNDFIIKVLGDTLCNNKISRWMCDGILIFVIGPDTSNINQTRLDVYINHTPAGASTKSVLHYAQLYKESEFLMYNYGSAERNEEHYGQATPPVYNLTKVTVPTLLYAGGKDWLADVRDVKRISTQLPNLKSLQVIPAWDHLDFTWAVDATKLCYNDLLTWLAKF